MTRRTTSPARRLVLLVALSGFLLIGACGGSEPRQIAFDSVPPTSSTTLPPTPESSVTASTRSPLPQVGPWVDVTANLAGMPSECGNLSFVTANPGRDQVIAGVALQGLWANDAGSDQWTRLGAGGQIGNRTATIVFDPERPDRFWESGHYGGLGAFRTTNGGQTFEALGDLRHLDGISVDFSDPSRGTLVAGAHERGDLYRSTNGGASWTNLGPNLPSDAGSASFPLVLDSQTYLLGTISPGGQGAPGIFRSTDGGATWQQVEQGGVGGLPLVASDGSIYWPLQDGGGLVRSTDGGASWRLVTGGGILSSYNVVELPDGRLASVSASRVIISDDQGITWRGLGPELPAGGAYGLTYSASRKAIYIWWWDCGDKVPPGSIQRLDISAIVG